MVEGVIGQKIIPQATQLVFYEIRDFTYYYFLRIILDFSDELANYSLIETFDPEKKR